MIFYNYSGFFGKRKSKGEEEERPTGPETTVSFDGAKWMWFMMIEKMCEKLNYKPEEVYELNYISCLNWMSMWKEEENYLNSLYKK